jgi:hypothetical protein
VFAAIRSYLPPFVTRDDTLARIAEILGAAAKAVLG